MASCGGDHDDPAAAAGAGAGNVGAGASAQPPHKAAASLAATSPAVLWISNTELFNKLQFASSMMLVDLQSRESFQRYHVRSALNIDWAAALRLAEENEELSTPVEILKHVSDIHDRRFRLRPYCELVVYAGGTNYAAEGGSADVASACSSPDELSSRELVMSFAECLLAEKKIKKDVLLVEGGIELILDVRPYLVKGSDSFTDIPFPTEVIEDFMYLGNYGCASNRECLDILGVTHVLNATNDCDSAFASELTYLQCEVEDDLISDIQQHFESVLLFIEKAMSDEKSRLLIHCKMGMSRSASFVILFLMKSRRMSLRKAYDFVKSTRPFISPNPSFLKQLSIYEKELFGATSIRFPDEPLSLGTLYEWLTESGKWEKRVVVRTASG